MEKLLYELPAKLVIHSEKFKPVLDILVELFLLFYFPPSLDVPIQLLHLLIERDDAVVGAEVREAHLEENNTHTPHVKSIRTIQPPQHRREENGQVGRGRGGGAGIHYVLLGRREPRIQ